MALYCPPFWPVSLPTQFDDRSDVSRWLHVDFITRPTWFVINQTAAGGWIQFRLLVCTELCFNVSQLHQILSCITFSSLSQFIQIFKSPNCLNNWDQTAGRALLTLTPSVRQLDLNEFILWIIKVQLFATRNEVFFNIQQSSYFRLPICAVFYPPISQIRWRECTQFHAPLTAIWINPSSVSPQSNKIGRQNVIFIKFKRNSCLKSSVDVKYLHQFHKMAGENGPCHAGAMSILAQTNWPQERSNFYQLCI